MLRDAGSDQDLGSLEDDEDDPEDRSDLARLGLDDEDGVDADDEDEDDEEIEAEDEEPVASTEEDDDSDETSLEDLLAKRAAARRGGDDSEGDVTEILEMTSEREPTTIDVEPPAGKVTPIRSDEFVCASCYLVKPRVQLADAERGFCRDCV